MFIVATGTNPIISGKENEHNAACSQNGILHGSQTTVTKVWMNLKNVILNEKETSKITYNVLIKLKVIKIKICTHFFGMYTDVTKP